MLQYRPMVAEPRYIDTHAHLCAAQFAEDRAAALDRAAAAGVHRVFEIGYDLPSSRAAVALAARHPQVWAVVGIQPHYASTTTGADLNELRALAAAPRVVAIGECGLDYFHDRAPHDAQEALFRRQLALARELHLPVVIHSRDAGADTIRILDSAARGQPGIMHSFSGDWAYAAACIEIGFHLSLSGPVTFRNASALHDVARRAPIERLLSETDSPYLAPHPLRGKRNEPANIPLIVAQIATLRGIAVAAAAAALWHNAAQLFRLAEEDM